MTEYNRLNGFRLLAASFIEFPRRGVIMLGCLVLAGFAEGIGVATVLPLLTLVTGTGGDTLLERTVLSILSALSLPHSIGALLALLAFGITLKSALVLVAMRQVGYTVAHIATDLRFRLIRSLMAAKWSHFVKNPVGLFSNAVSVEVQNASGVYLSGVRMIAAALQALAYLALALLISWQVTLLTIVAAAIIIVTLSRLIALARLAGRRQAVHYNELVARLSDGLYGIKALKAMGWEGRLGPLLERETAGINSALRLQVLSGEMMRNLQEPLIMIFLAGGLFAAISFWDVPNEVILTMGLLFFRAVNMLGLVQKGYMGLVSAEGFYQSIRSKIAETSRAIEPVGGRAAPKFSRDIRLDHVDFSYDAHMVLRATSMVIPFGAITALTGPSGVGKTTVADLIIGLYQPSGGSILIDGMPLADLNNHSWRHQIGYVPQDPTLFHDTILANVTLNDPKLTLKDAEAALKDSGASNIIERLPEGLDTVVGERGGRLSGGQRQRISLARALVRHPRLLILDEATTALDPETEAEICESLVRLKGRVTILTISHQTAMVEIADHVYSMDDGMIGVTTTPRRSAETSSP